MKLPNIVELPGSPAPSIIQTSSPNDPLNWPLWRRDAIVAILFFASFFTTASGAVLGTAAIQITTEFDISLSKYANLSAWWFAAVAVGAIIFVPFARVYGKRHQFLLGTGLTFAGYLWNARATSFGSFAGARVLQGLGTAIFETLLGTTIGDMYHVYQRGKRLSFTSWSTYAAGYTVIVITGIVVQHLGWRYLFWIMTPIQGVMFLLVFFLVPETSFQRPESEESSLRSESSIDEKASYVQVLSLFRGRVSHESVWKFFIKPFLLLLQPAVLWFVIFNGATITWGTLMDTAMVITFPYPPLNFTPTQVGFISFAGLAGTLIALTFCALTSDPLSAYMTRRNHGVYQPEFRLVLVIPAIITGFVGMYCFGIFEADIERYGWFPSAFCYGLQAFSLVVSVVVGSAYIVDGYPTSSNEAFILLVIVKNMIAFGMLTKAATWVQQGVYNLMLGTSLVQLFLGLLTIFIYIYGHRIRKAYGHIDFFHVSHEFVRRRSERFSRQKKDADAGI